MRLLHSKTLAFHDFYDDSIPPYAILSHTWGNEELSYEDMCRYHKLLAFLRKEPSTQESLPIWQAAGFATDDECKATERLPESRGFKKIIKTASIAGDCDYIWVDTCCIQKSSSAELQEAINSMYRWYQRSAACLVYLEDVDVESIEDVSVQLQKCRWIGRGWTLQELIAPRNLNFYDKNWELIADKRGLLTALHEATGIPQHVLATRDLSRASVAQKMSWAAKRTTTRVEDRAYSLLGIFGVHMAMLYGEGENAFRRLQEEILRTTPDDSIFTWQAQELDYSICSGLLANSPSEFQHCGNILQGVPIYTSTSNLGIRLDIEISPFNDAGEHDPLYAGWLRSGTLESRCYIILRPLLLEDEYGVRCTRVMASTPAAMPTQPLRVKRVIVRQEPDIPSGLTSALKHSFHIRRSDNYDLRAEYRIVGAWPPEQYSAETRQLFIPKGKVEFTGVIFLESYSTRIRDPSRDSIQLVLGQVGDVPRTWCKFVRHSWPEMSAPESSWRAAIEGVGNTFDCGTASAIKVHQIRPLFDHGHDVYLTAAIETGLFRNRLSLLVSIDGLRDDSIY